MAARSWTLTDQKLWCFRSANQVNAGGKPSTQAATDNDEARQRFGNAKSISSSMFDEDTNKGNDYEKKAMLSKFSVGRSHLITLNAAVVSSMVGLDYLAGGARLAHIFMCIIVTADVSLCLVELQRHGAVLLLSGILHVMPCSRG